MLEPTACEPVCTVHKQQVQHPQTLCGTRSFCAGGFQAVTVLSAPPPSNTNFPHLNLKGFTANRLQSTVYWIQWHKQLSRASRRDHLLGYCFYWCQTNTKCRSAVGWNAFTCPCFQVYSIPKASVWNLGCLCWELLIENTACKQPECFWLMDIFLEFNAPPVPSPICKKINKKNAVTENLIIRNNM